jgi:hypothetical protein
MDDKCCTEYLAVDTKDTDSVVFSAEKSLEFCFEIDIRTSEWARNRQLFAGFPRFWARSEVFLFSVFSSASNNTPRQRPVYV